MIEFIATVAGTGLRVAVAYVFIRCVCGSFLFKTEETRKSYDFGVIMSGLLLLLIV